MDKRKTIYSCLFLAFQLLDLNLIAALGTLDYEAYLRGLAYMFVRLGLVVVMTALRADVLQMRNRITLDHKRSYLSLVLELAQRVVLAVSRLQRLLGYDLRNAVEHVLSLYSAIYIVLCARIYSWKKFNPL